MSTITFEHQIDVMTRRELKEFIESRGRSFADCRDLHSLRERAHLAFHSPRNSKIDVELPAQRILREAAEKKAKENERKTRKKQRKPSQGRLITHARRKSMSEMTLPTDDQLNEKRHITFKPSGGKLGISLAPRTCNVATIRENSQAHWAGVQCGWTLKKVNGNTVLPNTVKVALKSAIQSKKSYSIDFNTSEGREKTPLPEENPIKPKGGNLVIGFVPTQDPTWVAESVPKHNETWATAGGAGPRRSVMPGSEIAAPGLKKKRVATKLPAMTEEKEVESEPQEVQTEPIMEDLASVEAGPISEAPVVDIEVVQEDDNKQEGEVSVEEAQQTSEADKNENEVVKSQTPLGAQSPRQSDAQIQAEPVARIASKHDVIEELNGAPLGDDIEL